MTGAGVRPLPPALARLLVAFEAGAPAALARAVSIVEDHRPGFDRLLAALHPRMGRARRIGITGPPGAGKSTTTTRLAAAFRARGERVGIVAVDPTSPFTGGALLGDRIRMESVALDPGVFIRSMATRGSLGGLASGGDAWPALRPVTVTPGHRPANDLLFALLRARRQLAIVVEDGRLLGVVTVEDLLEELVGEIRDEHDEP